MRLLCKVIKKSETDDTVTYALTSTTRPVHLRITIGKDVRHAHQLADAAKSGKKMTIRITPA